MGKLDLKYSYPNDPNYTYEPTLEIIDIDEDKRQNILYEHGFHISDIQSTFKKDLKNPNGIYSPKFGPQLGDVSAFGNRYRCQCGNLSQRRLLHATCPLCGKKVKFVDDDLNIFGWMSLYEYHVIHPNLFKSISSYIGPAKFEEIIGYQEKKDKDGHKIIEEYVPTGKKEDKYNGIGMIDFKEKFEEIMDYFYTPKKKEKYDHIMKNKDKVFTQSLPCYSVILRPFEVTAEKFTFEDTNKMYQMMTKLVTLLNDKYVRSAYSKKTKNQLLYDLEMKWQELYTEIEKILSGKKGQLRNCFGGRCSFSNRNVIIPNWKLRINEVILPYQALVELLQQRIINILHKMYSISYADAYNIWMTSQMVVDQRVVKIINEIIKIDGGIPVIINRNPKCVGASL